MKNTYNNLYLHLILGIILSLILFSFSQNDIDPEFSMYLVKNCDICSCDPGGYNIDSLELHSLPLLTSHDLISYNWNEHILSLKDSSSNQLKNIINNDSGGLHNKFFVVMAGNERIYLGVIWSVFSSAMTCYPYISSPFISRSIQFSKYTELVDPRNDDRIRNALKIDGILEE